MGMSSGSGNKNGVQSEINVTPLIDVLLVLLIIFLVVMPIMMKMETLEIPRKISDNEQPSSDATMLTLKVLVSGDVVVDENGKETVIKSEAVLATIRPKIETMKSDKVVFVDFENAVEWAEVVRMMDTIRSIATDVNKDEIKVALKVREDKPGAVP